MEQDKEITQNLMITENTAMKECLSKLNNSWGQVENELKNLYSQVADLKQQLSDEINKTKTVEAQLEHWKEKYESIVSQLNPEVVQSILDNRPVSGQNIEIGETFIATVKKIINRKDPTGKLIFRGVETLLHDGSQTNIHKQDFKLSNINLLAIHVGAKYVIIKKGFNNGLNRTIWGVYSLDHLNSEMGIATDINYIGCKLTNLHFIRDLDNHYLLFESRTSSYVLLDKNLCTRDPYDNPNCEATVIDVLKFKKLKIFIGSQTEVHDHYSDPPLINPGKILEIIFVKSKNGILSIRPIKYWRHLRIHLDDTSQISDYNKKYRVRVLKVMDTFNYFATIV